MSAAGSASDTCRRPQINAGMIHSNVESRADVDSIFPTNCRK